MKKANRLNKPSSSIAMKTGVAIVVGSILIFSLTSNKETSSIEKPTSEIEVPLNFKPDKGSFSTSEFLIFKKEYLKEDLSNEKKASDKVLFKAFVKSTKENEPK